MSSLRLVEDLARVVDALAGLDARRESTQALTGLMAGIDRQVNRLGAVSAGLTSEFARREAHRATGHKDVQHFLQDALRRSPGAAKRQVDTARQLEQLPDTRRALEQGEISFEHATRIAEGTKAASTDDEATLLSVARRGNASQVGKLARRLERQADARAEAEARARRQWAQRTFTLSQGADGTGWPQGRLTPWATERLRTAIDALARPHGPDDDRTPGQRRHDALAQLADAVATGEVPRDGGLPVHVTVVVTTDEIERRAGLPPGTLDGIRPLHVEELADLDRPRPADDAGRAGALDTCTVSDNGGRRTQERQVADDGWGQGVLSWTGVATPPDLEAAICDAQLTWLLGDGRGVPLRLGRTQRFADRAQRRALKVRDGGCRWPGCSMRAEWCIAHHVVFVGEPGWGTDLELLVLLCDSHHNFIHHGGWRLEVDDHATVTVTAPDGRHTATETAADARRRHLHGFEFGSDGHDRVPEIRGDACAREHRAEYIVRLAPRHGRPRGGPTRSPRGPTRPWDGTAATTPCGTGGRRAGRRDRG